MRWRSNFLDAHYNKYWVVSEGVGWPKFVLRYFFLLNSFFRFPDSIGLVGNHPTLLLKLCCYRLLELRIFCHCSCCCQTVTKPFSWLVAFFLWYLTPEVIYGKPHGFSIFLGTLICRLVFLLDSRLWKAWRISILTCEFVFFYVFGIKLYVLH